MSTATLMPEARLERARLNYRLATTWMVVLSGHGDDVMARAMALTRSAEVELLAAHLAVMGKEDE